MDQTWTLHVENFARIKKADIEISPLMCFIGDNNSGKSYIMSLLWGILVFDNNVLQHMNLDGTNKLCEEFLKKKAGEKFILDDAAQQMYVDWFNEFLSLNKEQLVLSVFNKNLDIGLIEIKNFKRTKDLTITLEKVSELGADFYINIENCIDKPHKFKSTEFDWWYANFLVAWSLIIGKISTTSSNDGYDNTKIYLPASRTGLLLVHRLIANKSIQRTFSWSKNDYIPEPLTAPYLQFLQFLNDLQNTKDNHESKIASLVNFLNEEIAKGTVISKEDGKIIRYLPNDMSAELPMSITSSVVTEIAPLLLLLKNQLPIKLLIIEEPEAHLHPALQKRMAQLLIRFVNKGIIIWITTHSDTILQHFNNMIKLNNRLDNEREELLDEFRYTKEDLLDSDKMKVYQFNRNESETEIISADLNKYGFIADSFNRAIDELFKEILAFQEDN